MAKSSYTFTIMQQIILGSAAFLIVILIAFITLVVGERVTDTALIANIPTQIITATFIFLVFSSILLLWSIVEIINIFTKTNTYHRWLLLLASLTLTIGPLIFYSLFSFISALTNW
jgi:hypothetical protein